GVLASSLGLTLASARHAPVFWTYLCLTVMGSTRTFLWAATAAFLPALVDRKDFSHAVNWNAGMFQMSSILGPIIGGALIDLTHGDNASLVYAANALGVLAFGVLISFVRTHHPVAAKEKITFKGLLTGFNFVFANRIILGIISLDMFAVLLGGAVMLLPI